MKSLQISHLCAPCSGDKSLQSPVSISYSAETMSMATERNNNFCKSLVFLQSCKLQLLGHGSSTPRCCVPWTDPGRTEDLPCRIPVSAIQLYSSLLLATQQVLKGVFCSVHPKLMLVKVVADNLGMSKMKYKRVNAVLCFFSIWNLYIWCRYIYFFVKNTVFCISIIHF